MNFPSSAAVSALRALRCAALALPFSLPLAATPLGHGGIYRGPGSTAAPGPGGSTSAGAPSTGGAGSTNTDSASWEQWWSLNRDRFLALKDAVHGRQTLTGDDDFFLGRGSSAATWGPGLRPTEEVVRGIVVPALRRALEGEKDTDMVSGILMALGKIGDEGDGRGASRIAPIIRPYLQHSNREIHETAAIALGVLANPRVAPVLVDLVADGSSGQALTGRSRVPVRTRAFATYGLGLIGYRAKNDAVKSYVVHHLASAIEFGDLPSPDVAVAGVIGMGLVRLADGAPPDPEDGARVRPGTSRQAQIQYLLNLFDDERMHARVRAYVPVALARLESGADPSYKDEIGRRFAAALEPRSRVAKIVQQGVVHGIALLGDGDGDVTDVALREALRNAIAKGDRLSRNLALTALARVATRRGGPAAGTGTSAPGDDPRLAAVAETRTLLLQQLSKGGSATRPWAAIGLGLLERERVDADTPASDGARVALRHALRSTRSPSEAGAYSIGLALMREGGEIAELTARTTNGDENARGYAAVALGLLDARDAMPTLRGIVRGERYRPGLVREAAIALALMGDKRAVPALLERLMTAKQMLEQVAMASALGFIGDARSVEPLVEILGDERRNDTARAFAAVALGLVCDKERLPWNSKLAADAGWWEAPSTLHDPLGGKGLLDLF